MTVPIMANFYISKLLVNLILSDASISTNLVPTFPFRDCGNMLQTLPLSAKEVGCSQQVLCLVKYSETVQVHIFSSNYSVCLNWYNSLLNYTFLKDHKVHRCEFEVIYELKRKNNRR